MISSWTKHSRSAHRRPCRSFSRTRLSRCAGGDQFGLQQFRHGGAKNIFASGGVPPASASTAAVILAVSKRWSARIGPV